MVLMKTYVLLEKANTRMLPPEFGQDDVRYSDTLVRYLLDAYTQPGGTVFDPFAGFGTTLLVAESLGRSAYGLEYDRRRCAYARSQLKHPERLLCGDARRLTEYELPPCDLSLTSPPYMARGEREDPLTAYAEGGRGYDAYLQDLASIYEKLRTLLKPGARAILEVSNLKGPDGVTTLAWDVARAVEGVLTFDGEVVVGWDRPYGYGYDHSYCLIFRR